MKNNKRILYITESQLKQIIEWEFKFDADEVKDKIMRLHGLPKEYKEFACDSKNN